MKRFFALCLALCLSLSCLCGAVHAAEPIGDPKVEPLQVLMIGNSFSRDCSFYLSSLAKLCGLKISVGYLYVGSCTLAMHADYARNDTPAYVYYKSDAGNGAMNVINSKAKVADVLKSQKWDIVSLQNGMMDSAMADRYEDLPYLIDMVKTAQPDAKLYWNMTWAAAPMYSNNNFEKLFNRDQLAMYDSIVDCLNTIIIPNGNFDKIVYAGAALQNMRALDLQSKRTAFYQDNMTRDLYHLSCKSGRLIAAMTWLKTIYPAADLDLITTAALEKILSNEYHTSDPDLDDTKYQNTDAYLADIKASVLLAVEGNLEKRSAPPIPDSGTAYVSRQSVDLDGKATEFDMYMLVDENGGETNFIKLRDIAYLLNGTPAQFSVGFSGNLISLSTKKPYAANGSEMQTPFSGERAYKACTTNIRINGYKPILTGITLTDDAGGEYNYFKLRDLGTALGFTVDWSNERGIFVTTGA